MSPRFRGDDFEEPSHYKTAQVCRNGHSITSDIEGSPELASKYCGTCGAETITECPECSTPIRGYYYVPGVIYAGSGSIPRHCHNCGKTMPWTKKAIDTAQEFASEIEGLSSSDQEVLRAAIPDLATEGPQAELAMVRYKTILAKVTPTIKATLDRVIVTVVSEAIKKTMGL